MEQKVNQQLQTKIVILFLSFLLIVSSFIPWLPIANAAKDYNFNAINEDTANYPGEQAKKFHEKGIAITFADNSNGQWQYYNGSVWYGIEAKSPTDAYLLGGDIPIRFIPKNDWNGTVAIKYQKWVSEQDFPNHIDAHINLLEHPGDFDNVEYMASLTVLPVNDAPYITEIGGSYYLDFAGNQYAEYPDLGIYSDSFTFEGWINLSSYQTWARIFDTSYGQDNFNIHLAFDGGKMVFEALPQKGVRTEQYKIVTTPFPLNQWIHVATVYDHSKKQASIYWDGVQKATGSMDLTKMANAKSQNGNIARPNNYFGKSTWTFDAYYMGGMRDVRFWNKVKTEQEIMSQMNANINSGASGLVALYKLNNPADGTTVVDSSGNGKNGTIYGSTWKSSIGFNSNLVTLQDLPVSKSFKVNDDGHFGTSNLTVFATSSNGILVPNQNITITGTGEERTILITPTPGQVGSTVITVHVSDGEFSSQSNFLLTVKPRSIVFPTVATTPISNLTARTVTIGGNVINEGSLPVTDRGIVYALTENPTITSGTKIGAVPPSGPGVYSLNITGLKPKTTYFARAYATSGEGTVYGQNVSFTTADLNDTESVQEAKNNLKIIYALRDSQTSVTKDVMLSTTGSFGTTITWTTNQSTFIDIEGHVNRPDYFTGDQTVTLTATIQKGSEIATKTFELIVKKTAYVAPTLTIQSSTINESDDNDGSLIGTQVVSITNGTFNESISNSDVIINNLPTGLSYNATRTAENTLTIEFTGKATDHSTEFSLRNASVTVKKEAINKSLTDLTSPTFAIEFTDPALLTVDSGSVNEKSDESYNTGEIRESLVIKLENGKFAEGIESSGVSVNNLPSGLGISVSKLSDTEITIEFTGSATNHDNHHDVTNASVEIDGNKIIGSNGSPLTSNTFKINFNEPEPYLFIQQPILYEAEKNDGSITGALTVELEHGEFKSVDFTSADTIQIENLPQGLDIDDVNVDGTSLIITLKGNADDHRATVSVNSLVLKISASMITPTAKVGDSELPITLTDAITSNSFAIIFQDPPPAIVVGPSIITDNGIDGSITETLVVSLENGTFDMNMDNGVVGHNLPEGVDISVTRISDTELTITFSGKALSRNAASENASVTIAEGKISNESNIATTTAITSNTFNLDAPSYATLLHEDKDHLEIVYQDGDTRESVTGNLGLPLTGFNGSMITWTTSPGGYVDGGTGIVTRPSYTQGDQTITLTATIQNGTETKEKTFEIKVKAQPMTDEEAVSIDKDSLEIRYASGDSASSVTQDITLPTIGQNGTTITWTASPDAYLDTHTGSITRPSANSANQQITVTATISKNGKTETKQFTLTIKKAEGDDPALGNALKVAEEAKQKAGKAKDDYTNANGKQSDAVYQAVVQAFNDLEHALSQNPKVVADIAAKTAVLNGKVADLDQATAELKRKRQSSSGSSSTPSQPQTKEITVDVQSGEGSVVSKTPITRTTEANGTVKDEVTFTKERAKETVEKIANSGQNVARIIVPDERNEVSEVKINVPIEATRELAGENISLELVTDNVKINIPSQSLQQLPDDLFFRVVPIKEEPKQKIIEERAKKEEIVKIALGNGNANVVGRPMEIETNMQSRPVTLVLPLQNVVIPTNAKEREKFLADLVIFIEHSDGEKELVKPEIVNYKNGQLGLQFGIEKFSTFTILNMENWQEYLASQEVQPIPNQSKDGTHQAYVAGFEGGVFKPSNSITRAEMAALLSRVGAGTNKSTTTSYPDVATTHWAAGVIQDATATGLMKGYTDGTFGPNKSITRAEMAAIISRWMGLTENGQNSYLSDINTSWAKTQIEQVSTAGIMKGMPDGTFQPNKALTRAETVVIFNRILKRGPLSGVTTPTWSDVSASHWAFNDIEEASMNHSYEKKENGVEILLSK